MKISNNYTNVSIRPSKITSKSELPASNRVSFGLSNPNQITQACSDILLELAKKLAKGLEEGKNQMVRDAMSLIQTGKVREAIATVSENIPPAGRIVDSPETTELLTFNWDGSPISHLYKKIEGFRNLGVVDKADSQTIDNLLISAFGEKPKTTVGAVGWTNIKPENVKGGTSLSKAEIGKKYEEAFSEFFAPVHRYLTEALGIKPKDIALTSSVSYSGIDKAIMDLAEAKKIPNITVTPYAYGIYARNEHPFPTVFTPEIHQYVDLYSKLADNIILTGGRDHAFKFDAGSKWLKNNQGLIIPVDLLKDYKGIEVPGMINGKIENAAALAFDSFSDPFAPGLMKTFEEMPSDALKQELQHPAQRALAAAIYKSVN